MASISVMLEQFERDWQHGEIPDLQSLVQTRVGEFESPSELCDCLRELVMLDLEMRWRIESPGVRKNNAAKLDRGTLSFRPRIDDYAALFPGLQLPRELSIDLIAEEYRVRWRWGDRPSHEHYLARFPDRRVEIDDRLSRIDDELFREFDLSLTRSIVSGDRQLHQAETSSSLSSDTGYGREQPNQTPTFPLFGDYEILAEVARGGMGVVFKARHCKLGRVVALKRLLSGPLANSEDLERFRAEARAAAQLDHPRIVPIFETGEVDKQPYIAMGFIEGTSLEAKLRQTPLPPRDAARITAQVAEAVHFAHSQGIVHRDLKPANILIDTDGTPRVTDFGLAKRTFTNEGLTATGQILGTPSYMSPEQTLGKSEQVGPASDVYSLGALLYASLTSQPPFRASSIPETLRQVAEKEPPSPRTINSEVPLDLEIICLKCLRKDPAERYADAFQVHAELQRFLDGEPIQARPLPWWSRLWKWCKRNPSLASVVGLLLASLIGLAASGSGMALVSQRYVRQMNLKNQALVTANAVAARNLHASETAVEVFLTEVSEDPELLANTPGAQALRKRLLTRAKDYYEQLLRDNSESELPSRMAHARIRLGNILDWTGDSAGALKEYEHAQTLLKQQLKRRPSQEDSLDLAGAFANSATALQELNKSDALRRAEEGREILTNLLNKTPEDRRLILALTKCELNLSGIYMDTHQHQLALEACHHAIRLGKMCEDEYPELNFAIGASLHNVAMNHAVEGRFEQALDELQQAIAHIRKGEPTAKHRRELARAIANVGFVQSQNHRQVEAQQAFDEALQITEELANDNPLVTDFQNALARLLELMAEHYRENSQAELAQQFFQRAARIRQQMTSDSPVKLARNYVGQARLFSEGQRWSKAEGIIRRGLELLKSAPATTSEDIDLLCVRGDLHTNLAVALAMQGDVESARPAFEEALRLATLIHSTHPEVVEYRRKLGSSYVNLAAIEIESQHFESALNHLDEGTKLLQQTLEISPELGEAQQHLMRGRQNRVAAQLGLARSILEKPHASPDDVRKVIQLAREASESKGTKQAEALALLAAAHATQRDFKLAIDLQRQAIEAASPAMHDELQATLTEYEQGLMTSPSTVPPSKDP